jgi:hypothetical protein
MSWDDRIDLYERIEAHRKRPLIAYVTSKRDGCDASMSSDALPQIIEQIDKLPNETKALDLLIASYGGDPMVAWRVMSLLRQRVEHVGVLVPQSAYSAATLITFGADEIVMHPYGHLGPVDMQITSWGDNGRPTHFSTEDVAAFLEFVRDNLKITDQEHVRTLFELTCKEVGSLGIGFTSRSAKLAIDLGERRLLALHMHEDEHRAKLRTIVQNMTTKFQSHGYTVSRREAIDIGLPVKKERDEVLEKLMWDTWLLIERDLKERTPFDPLLELMKSNEASKLLAPVPLINLPMAASASAHFSTTIADVMSASTITVEPVDFELKLAIVESSRSASAHTTKGKILATRNPDLAIKYQVVTTSREWENVSKSKN